MHVKCLMDRIQYKNDLKERIRLDLRLRYISKYSRDSNIEIQRIF